jgi:lipid-A-disaccharide synthase
VYAGDFVRELRALHPGTRFLGLGGAEMTRAGVEIVVDQRDLGASGLVELIPDLHRIVRTWRRMVAALRAERPDLVVLVDSSGLNIPFARRARRLGVPTLYYVSPQVWGWRTGRIRKIARWVNRLAVIFPFEPAVYADTGVPVEFVGHPLVERLRESSTKLDRATARSALGLDANASIAALLPCGRGAHPPRAAAGLAAAAPGRRSRPRSTECRRRRTRQARHVHARGRAARLSAGGGGAQQSIHRVRGAPTHQGRVPGHAEPDRR